MMHDAQVERTTAPHAPRGAVRTCPCCGLVQVVPEVPAGMRARCGRCGTTFRERGAMLRGNTWTAAIALTALILYPMAVTMPMLRVERLGHATESSIIDGTITLLTSGHVFVGLVVLLCSIVLPPGKLVALFVLSTGGGNLHTRHRAITYQLVEFTGRWGMLDVLLVAILVATLKLGDLVDVAAGSAAFMFTGCVLLSLIATATFNPRALWPSGDEPLPLPDEPCLGEGR